MKQILKAGLAGLFFSLILLGGVTVHAILQVQSYGRLINYVGIVRGATQRLVKLELAQRPDDEMAAYLDGILLELSGGEGRYGLPFPRDENYRQNLDRLCGMWSELREEISRYRAGTGNGSGLLDSSESYFGQANVTVFAAEEYAARQARILLSVCAVMLGIMLLTWMFIFWAYSQKLLLLESTNRQLSDLTRRDSLTGAYQFSAFKEEAQRLLDAPARERYAVVYTDFADFKYINDVFGYTYGDSILARYGVLLRRGLHEGELMGRVNADNFVLVLHYQDRAEIAERMRQADREITEFMHSSYGRQTLPTCCGICCVDDVAERHQIDGFLDRANFARKTVKNGTNQNYTYYDESIRDRLLEEKDLEIRMEDALRNREFSVYYQPKVELAAGRIAGAEALVRWCSGSGVVIAPDRFIPVFERKLLIGRLDQFVFEEVCRWLRGQLDAGRPALPVSVNVSRLQFYDEDFVRRYVEIRDRYAIPPGLLEIEFTESIVFDNAAQLLNIVADLRREGFGCSIDDFGKGYSSLSLLKSLPVNVLKIDRFFFLESGDRERDMAVVRGIVELVHQFDIRTVAEGIESMELVEKLKAIGCDYVQGYVFYRPMPQDAFERLLTTEQEKEAVGS